MEEIFLIYWIGVRPVWLVIILSWKHSCGPSRPGSSGARLLIVVYKGQACRCAACWSLSCSLCKYVFSSPWGSDGDSVITAQRGRKQWGSVVWDVTLLSHNQMPARTRLNRGALATPSTQCALYVAGLRMPGCNSYHVKFKNIRHF